MKTKLAISTFCIVPLLILFVFKIFVPQERDATNAEQSPPVASSASQPPIAVEEPKYSLAEGHAKMVDALKQVQLKSKTENYYLNDSYLKDFEAQLVEFEVDGMIHADLRLSKGVMIRNLGRTDEALEILIELYEILKEAEQPQAANISYQVGVTYLRAAENQNCIDNHTSESCLLPIKGKGVHVNKEYATKAMDYFYATLESKPDHIPSIWLLNLSAMAIGSYPEGIPTDFLISPESFESEEPFPKFKNIASGLGLDIMTLCGGSIADDFNGDGFLDIVTSSWNPEATLRIFMNQGDGQFRDATPDAGFKGIFGGLNINQADYDNDGDLDIFVMRGAWLREAGRHPNSLLQNDGQGHFVDVTFNAGLADAHYPTSSAAWADFDNDGDLDLLIGNELYPNQLFQNNGDGTFNDIAEQTGLTGDRFTKAVMWGDYDNDRYPDIYFSNLDGPNQLYHNEGNGTFKDVSQETRVTLPLSSFPGWFWDFNNDGALDLFVGAYNAQVEHIALAYLGQPHKTQVDRLFQGDGTGGFKDVTYIQNLGDATHPMGANFGDLDNDGYPDFYLGTGDTSMDAIMPNLMYRNRRGTGFSNVSTSGGFAHLQKGHGISFADLDNDGDQDIFAEMGGAFKGDAYMNALFENPGFSNNWLNVRLVGTTSNRSAIGARIKCTIEEYGTKRDVFSWVNSGGSFGANPLRNEIGLGKATAVEQLEIYWPTSDTTQHFENLDINQFIQVTEGDQHFEMLPLKSVAFQTTNHESGQGSHH